MISGKYLRTTVMLSIMVLLSGLTACGVQKNTDETTSVAEDTSIAEEPVASHWQQHDTLGTDLVEGLREQGATIYGKGHMGIDLTQTSYSTIPSVDMELGNAYSDHSDVVLEQLATGLLTGINTYFEQ